MLAQQSMCSHFADSTAVLVDITCHEKLPAISHVAEQLMAQSTLLNPLGIRRDDILGVLVSSI